MLLVVAKLYRVKPVHIGGKTCRFFTSTSVITIMKNNEFQMRSKIEPNGYECRDFPYQVLGRILNGNCNVAFNSDSSNENCDFVQKVY